MKDATALVGAPEARRRSVAVARIVAALALCLSSAASAVVWLPQPIGAAFIFRWFRHLRELILTVIYAVPGSTWIWLFTGAVLVVIARWRTVIVVLPASVLLFAWYTGRPILEAWPYVSGLAYVVLVLGCIITLGLGFGRPPSWRLAAATLVLWSLMLVAEWIAMPFMFVPSGAEWVPRSQTAVDAITLARSVAHLMLAWLALTAIQPHEFAAFRRGVWRAWHGSFNRAADVVLGHHDALR